MTILQSKGNAAITKTGLIATIAALLFAMSEPSFAARTSRKPADSAPAQRSDKARVPAYDPQGTSRNPFGPGRNLPYPDRPYGDPGRW
jgi:hypothetical protein